LKQNSPDHRTFETNLPDSEGDQAQELDPNALVVLAVVGGAITLGLTVAQVSATTSTLCGEFWIVFGVGLVLLIAGVAAGRFGQIMLLVILGVIGVLLIAIGAGSLYAQSCSFL
jgi:hypothetical protein